MEQGATGQLLPMQQFIKGLCGWGTTVERPQMNKATPGGCRRREQRLQLLLKGIQISDGQHLGRQGVVIRVQRYGHGWCCMVEQGNRVASGVQTLRQCSPNPALIRKDQPAPRGQGKRRGGVSLGTPGYFIEIVGNRLGVDLRLMIFL